jgi:hypothetical protein
MFGDGARVRRWFRLALRLAAADGSDTSRAYSGSSDDTRGPETDSREGSFTAGSSNGSAAAPPASGTSELSSRGAISGSGSCSGAMLFLYITGLTRSETVHDANQYNL